MNTLIITEAELIIKGDATVQLRISAVLLRKPGRWDAPYAVIVDMTYTGENSSGQKVGNFTFTINYSEDSSDSQQISGSFIENEDATGTMTKSNGQTMNYSIYWSTDHNNMTVTGVDGSSTIDLMDATWAYANVG